MLETPSPTDTSGSHDLDLELQEIAGHKSTEPKTATAPAIPEKYKDKSLEDIITMHQNAEKLISRQGNDIAEIKRAAAVLAEHAKVTVAKEVKPVPTTVEDLLNNPDKAIEGAVAASPALRKIQADADRVNQLESRLAYGDFVRKHPGYQEDITNDEFMNWIKKNPVRVALSQRADALDFNSADALWDLWNEHKELVGTPQERTEKVRQASNVRGTPTENKGKPVYSRLKLDELRAKAHDGDPAAQSKLADPEFNARIVEAYADNRVR